MGQDASRFDVTNRTRAGGGFGALQSVTTTTATISTRAKLVLVDSAAAVTLSLPRIGVKEGFTRLGNVIRVINIGAGAVTVNNQADTPVQVGAALAQGEITDFSAAAISDTWRGDKLSVSGVTAPTAHAGQHTDGTDDIQDATAAQKGLATAAQITKLDGIEAGATADQSDAEIETAYNNQVAQVSAGEKTAGTETAVRRFSPDDVKDMIDTHGGSGSGDLLAANNLSDVANAATAFANIKQAATTSATGVVELATDGETAAGKVVQGNDSRLVSSGTRFDERDGWLFV